MRLAAETVAREVENRAPDLATSKWWKEERQGVFVDFNQNAKDRTVASAYSVRANARRPGVDAADLGRGARLPARRRSRCRRCWSGTRRSATRGRAWTTPPGSLDALLDLAERLGPAEKPPKGAGPAHADDAADRDRAGEDQARRRWPAWSAGRQRHPAAAAKLEPADVLVDGMRGRSSIWYRIRVNLQHVPEAERPPQEPLEVDYDPWANTPWAQPKQQPEG